MTTPLHERVSDLAIIAGIAVTPADIEAIDQLLIEERRLAAGDNDNCAWVGDAGDTDRLGGGTHTNKPFIALGQRSRTP